VYHFGGDKGFRSLLVIFPEQNFGVTILMNGDLSEDLREQIAYSIAGLVLQ
jgi:CubicO group peptidase (beta-lactamase class C family)